MVQLGVLVLQCVEIYTSGMKRGSAYEFQVRDWSIEPAVVLKAFYQRLTERFPEKSKIIVSSEGFAGEKKYYESLSDIEKLSLYGAECKLISSFFISAEAYKGRVSLSMWCPLDIGDGTARFGFESSGREPTSGDWAMAAKADFIGLVRKLAPSAAIIDPLLGRADNSTPQASPRAKRRGLSARNSNKDLPLWAQWIAWIIGTLVGLPAAIYYVYLLFMR